MKIFYTLLIVSIFIVSCVSKTEYDKLQEENNRLLSQIDECQNGAERLKAKIDDANKIKDYEVVAKNIYLLIDKHPEEPKIEEYKKLLNVANSKIQEQREKEEAEEKERIRIANLNNTGPWIIRNYVDEFGESTKKRYIANKAKIRGTFSNSAVQDRELDVDFLINSASDLSIMLYEYAGNNPVKAYSHESYNILIQDKDDKRFKLSATNYSDRLHFDKNASWLIHSALMKGGTVKFRISEYDNSINEYNFNISDATYYDNAYRILTKGK